MIGSLGMLIAYFQKGQPFPVFVKFETWHIAHNWILLWWMVHHIPSANLIYSYTFQHFPVFNRTHTHTHLYLHCIYTMYIYNMYILQIYIYTYIYIYIQELIHRGCSIYDSSIIGRWWQISVSKTWRLKFVPSNLRLISSRSIWANYGNLSKIIPRKWRGVEINFLLPTVWPFWKHCLWKKN